jgi:anti-anti-sigma factor
MLQLSVRRSADTVVVHCTGRIVAGEALSGLQRTATAQEAAELAIDLEEVEILDAAGLGTLLQVRHWCEKQGTDLKIMNPNKHVREVLALTALDSVLAVEPAENGSDAQALPREWACAEK